MANNNNFAEKIFHGPFKCYLKAKQVSRFAQLIQNITSDDSTLWNFKSETTELV